MIKKLTRASQSSRYGTNILNAIGDTPLIELSGFLNDDSISLFGKLESFNPGGSAKDRPARQMIEAALAQGEIDQNTAVIESSSGNMGIGLAQICRVYGLRFICVVDPRVQTQNVAIMRALGAEIEMVEQPDPINNDFLVARLNRVQQLLNRIPNSYWSNQYANRNNPLSHQMGTVAEIDEALDGDFDYLFVATSSTGTAQGCRDFLSRRGRRAKVVAVDAEGSVLFDGHRGKRMIPGLGAGKISELAKGQSFDHVRRVSDLECVAGCRRLARTNAMLVGGSAGGVLQVIRRNQKEFAESTCVAILHDSGTRYLDTVYDDAWVKKNLHCSSAELAEMVA